MVTVCCVLRTSKFWRCPVDHCANEIRFRFGGCLFMELCRLDVIIKHFIKFVLHNCNHDFFSDDCNRFIMLALYGVTYHNMITLFFSSEGK